MAAHFRAHFPALGILGLAAVLGLAAAETEDEPKPKIKETLKALVLEDAKHLPPAKPAAQAPVSAAKAGATPSPVGAPGEVPPEKPAKPQEATATPLPKVEIRSRRITETDMRLRETDREMARESKNAKSSELDKALNDDQVSKFLSIFGGKSAAQREGIAQERLALLDAEKDLIEAIGRAKTKREKDELEEQLRDIKALRRDLEKAPN